MDIIKRKMDNVEEEYFSNYLENKYVPNFWTITRSNNKGGGSCIDNVFSKIKNTETKTFKLMYKITDHEPLLLLIKTRIIAEKVVYNEKTRIDYNKLEKHMAKINWDRNYSNDVDIFLSNILRQVEKVIVKSSKKMKLSNKSRPNNDWITTGLIKSCETKEKLYKAWQKDHSNKILGKKYKKYSNKLNNLIIYAKQKYDKDKVNKLKNDCRKL